MDKTTQTDAVSAVVKVFSILSALGEQKEIGVSELSQRLLMSKATTFRFLQTMKQLGYVEQEGEADKYSLTLKLFELGAKSLEYVNLIEIADKEMRHIGQMTHEAVHLGALDDDAIIYIHKIDSSYNLRMYSRVGRRNPLYCTAIGKILLAWQDEETIRLALKDESFTKKTDTTILSVDDLLVELAAVREHHYAQDREEQELGLRCIAVPVYDRLGHVVAGLSISFPTIRFDEQQLDHYVQLLKASGRRISEKMGYHHYPE